MTLHKLEAQLRALDAALLARLQKRGFDADQLLGWAASIGGDHGARNRLKGEVREIDPAIVHGTPEVGSVAHDRLTALGAAALASGELAVCVLVARRLSLWRRSAGSASPLRDGDVSSVLPGRPRPP